MGELRRYYLRCSHDDDNDFLETEDATGTWCKAADVDAVLAEKNAELARAQQRMSCGLTSPVYCGECNVCLRTELAQAKAQLIGWKDKLAHAEFDRDHFHLRADRAEAACAEMATDIRSIMSNPLLDTLAWRELNKVMGNPNPGSRYLELAKLVEYLVPAIEQSLEEQPLVPHDADAPSGNVTITWRTGRDVAEAILRWNAGQP